MELILGPFCLCRYAFYRANAALLTLPRKSEAVTKELRARSRKKNIVTALLCTSALMIETPARRHTISLFLFPRALDTLTCIGVKKAWIPRIPYAPTILFSVSFVQHAACFVVQVRLLNIHLHGNMQVCQVVIMTCWAKFPQYLDPAYNRLIYKWCGDMTQKEAQTGMDASCACGLMRNAANGVLLFALTALHCPDPSLPVGCHHCGFHKEESCLQYQFWYFLDRWQQHSLMFVLMYARLRLALPCSM